MKTGKYTLREFFSNRDLCSFIIPEIQRDYVWGKEQIEKLLESIIQDYSEFEAYTPIQNIANVSQEIIDNFNGFYKKNYLSSNIGFIYAYSDADYPGSYFLIDGQQRFTSIFLTLLVIAANGTDETITKFKRIYTNNHLEIIKPKVDYRVRESSHIFLSKLIQTIEKSKKELSSGWIKKQSWFLQDYGNDKTINSIIQNIDIIRNFLSREGKLNDYSFLDYLENYLEFWYFDTNISEQGEELYIFMNARGEFMQAHENLKADLIGKLSNKKDKKSYGEAWEKWQDFFWQNRGDNVNADKGFNEFLCCIAGLENKDCNKVAFYSKDDFASDTRGKKNKIEYADLLNTIDVLTIEKYIVAIQNLFSSANITRFTYRYSYYDWINKAKEEFWRILNCEDTNWFADYKDENSGTERNRMVYVWSMLKYVTEIDWNTVSIENVYRTFRLFYVRYNNYDRTVDSSLNNMIS